MRTQSSPILSLPGLNSSRARRTLSSSLYLGNKCHHIRSRPSFQGCGGVVRVKYEAVDVGPAPRVTPPTLAFNVGLLAQPTEAGLQRFRQTTLIFHWHISAAGKPHGLSLPREIPGGMYMSEPDLLIGCFPSLLMNPHVRLSGENSMSVYSFYPVASI